MLEHLFGSQTRLKVLRFFFRHPGQAFFVREITRLLEGHIHAIRRELDGLSEAGVLRIREGGADRKKYYELNTASLLYPELHSLLVKDDMLHEQAFAEEIKQAAGEAELILLTGQFVNDNRAASDVLLVGDAIRERALANRIAQYEKDSGREVRYTVMSVREFQDRRQVMDKFLFSLFEARHVKVVDTISKGN